MHSEIIAVVIRSTKATKGDSPIRRGGLGQSPKHSAFTLLEVILALSLSALVLFTLGLAVDMNLRLLDSGRTEVEEAQLARAVMQIIARDISGSVFFNPSDVQKLMSTVPSFSINQTAQNQQSGANQNASTGGGGQGGGQVGGPGGGQSGGSGGGSGGQGGQSSQSSFSYNVGNSSVGSGGNNTTEQSDSSSTDAGTNDSSRTTDLTDAAPQSMPGLFGNANELLIDVSRVPRLDQFNTSTKGNNNAIVLCDMRTVAYYVVQDDVFLALGANYDWSTSRGLVRREMDRAAAIFASQHGKISDTDNNLQPFAPEVEAIVFRYFDGSQWLKEWDSVAQNGLPPAVEINLAITRQHPRNNVNPQPITYRMVVNIPTANTSNAQTSSTQTTSAETTSTQSTSAQTSP